MDDLARYTRLMEIVERDGVAAISPVDFDWLRNFQEDMEAADAFINALPDAEREQWMAFTSDYQRPDLREVEEAE